MEFSKREIDYLKTLNRMRVKNPIKDYDEKMNGELKFHDSGLTWYELDNDSKTDLFKRIFSK